MKKKKACEAKAHTIVVKMLDPINDEELLKVMVRAQFETGFLSCKLLSLLLQLRDINQSHYQDIVEERAIMKLCGFPPCKDPVSE